MLLLQNNVQNGVVDTMVADEKDDEELKWVGSGVSGYFEPPGSVLTINLRVQSTVRAFHTRESKAVNRCTLIKASSV